MKRPFLFFSLLFSASISHAVDFPGAAPGAARGGALKTGFVLENNVLNVRWTLGGGLIGDTLRPAEITNKISGQQFEQRGRELFRLSTPQPAVNATPGTYFGVRWNDDVVDALFSTDGRNWRTLKSMDRADFPGQPTLLRAGKTSLKADATDFADPGAAGTSRVSEIRIGASGETAIAVAKPAKVTTSPRAGTTAEFDGTTLKIGAAQNSTAFADWPLQNAGFVGARVWKDSDQGLSWGPGIAVVWPGGQFVKINARSQRDFAVTTPQSETLLGAGSNYPLFNLPASQFRLEAAPQIRRFTTPALGAKKAATGQELTAAFRHATLPIRVAWSAKLADGAHYVRQSLKVLPGGASPQLSGVELLDCAVPNAKQFGSVPGSPIEASGLFFGVEVPFGVNEAKTDGLQAGLLCPMPLVKGAAYQFSSVIGVAPQGQLRRAFLAYLERERARPSSPILQYNSKFDLAQRVNEKDLLASIESTHRELTAKRGVKLDSYVIDDGWDDVRGSFWGLDAKKFPAGFAPVSARLKALNSQLGLWISPIGGYGEASQRIASARKRGLTGGDNLDLSNPAYYSWFKERSAQFIRENGVNYFEWDKAGAGVSADTAPHFLALFGLARELRAANPNLFINATLGTWPSPFFLNHVDATWRGGGDMGWTGAGNKREQWLTYRDLEIYRQVVQRAPLYPLNAVSQHGIVLGQFYQGQDVAAAGPDLRHDARLFFANGAMHQELYLTPSLMTSAGWDDVAAAAKWAKANTEILADAHWLGGNPQRGEVYGYASWAPRKGIFVLRNPSDKPAAIALDAAKIFELPAGATQNFKLQSPYADTKVPFATLRAGESATFKLEPFEVMVFEALPQN